MADLGPPATTITRRLHAWALLALNDSPSITQEPRFCRFLTEEIQPSDYSRLTWQSPSRVTRFCEILYGFPFPNDEAAERIRMHVATLLK